MFGSPGGFEPDLFDDRRVAPAAGAAFGRRLSIEGPAIHTIETNLVTRIDRGVLADDRTGVRPRRTVEVSRRTGERPIRGFRRDLKGPPSRDSWFGCASTWGRRGGQHRADAALRGPSSRSAACCSDVWCEKFGREPIWEGPFRHQRIAQAEIAVRLRCYTRPNHSSSKLMKLKIGGHPAARNARETLGVVAVRCGSVTLTEGRMGRSATE